MKRFLFAALAAMLIPVAPAAFADEGCEPLPPPEGAIELGTRDPFFTYTVTVEAGNAIATVGDDDCSLGRGWVNVDGVTIPAPTEMGGRTTAELGFLEAGTYTFDVTVKGRISVWLLIATVPAFDGMLACNEATTPVGDGEEAPMASFLRGDDDSSEGKNPEPCSVEIGYTLDSDTSASEQTVEFGFETSEFPSWFGEFTWTAEPADMPVQPTMLDLDDDGSADTPLVWCDGFSGHDDATGLPLPIMPEGESWCLISQSSSVVGAGVIQVTQSIYGLADPGFIRPK